MSAGPGDDDGVVVLTAQTIRQAEADVLAAAEAIVTDGTEHTP